MKGNVAPKIGPMMLHHILHYTIIQPTVSTYKLNQWWSITVDCNIRQVKWYPDRVRPPEGNDERIKGQVKENKKTKKN